MISPLHLLPALRRRNRGNPKARFLRVGDDLRALGLSDRERDRVLAAALTAHERTGAGYTALTLAAVHATAVGIQPAQMQRHLLLIARLSTYQVRATPMPDVATTLLNAVACGRSTSRDLLAVARWGIDLNRLDELLGGPSNTQELFARTNRGELTTAALIDALDVITTRDTEGC